MEIIKLIMEKDIEELLSCLWTDAGMAIDGTWDRSDSGFKDQRTLIEEFCDKYELVLTKVIVKDE